MTDPANLPPDVEPITSPAPGAPQTAHKAIVALLTGGVGIVAMFIPGIAEHITPTVISAIATVITAVLVYAVPNRPAA